MRRALPYSLSLLSFVAIGMAWELVVHYGGFPPKLVPGLTTILDAFVRLASNGILLQAILATLFRLLLGFALAAAIGLLLGILMGRYQLFEDLLLPIVSFLYPIPGIAYAPLFVLWFGLGDLPTILMVGAASNIVIALNTWRGVKTVNPLWVKSAQVMGARDHLLMRHVIFPATLPFILVGLRLGLANAWRILIAVEMLMSVQRGLGWLIFSSQTFLNTDVMLATIATIGCIGLVLEKQIFGRIEQMTVVRWGMVR